MSEMQQFKCPHCGGTMAFNSASQKLKCDFCDSEFDVDKLDEINAVTSDTNADSDAQWAAYSGESMEGMSAYNCSSCGAHVVVDANTVATECVYCGNRIVIENNVAGVAKPDVVIPFALDKDYAVNALKNFYKGKILLPGGFLSGNRVEKITGLYVPFWLYDCDVNAQLTFTGEDVSTWVSGDYEYTKTDYYSIRRSGSLGFNSIPVDASSGMDDSYMDSLEPYSFDKLVKFNPAFLAGYQADRYDEDAEKCLPRVNKRIKNSVIEEFQNTISGYSSVSVKSTNIDMKHGNISYAFLPIWILNTKYQDKIYTFALNAQTGKMVGTLPVSWGKFFALWGASAAVAYLIITIISMIMG